MHFVDCECASEMFATGRLTYAFCTIVGFTWHIDTSVSLSLSLSLMFCVPTAGYCMTLMFCVPTAGYCMTNDLMPSIFQSQMKMRLIIAQLYRTQWTLPPSCSMLITATILHVLHSCRTLILLFPMQRHASCTLSSIFDWIGSFLCLGNGECMIIFIVITNCNQC